MLLNLESPSVLTKLFRIVSKQDHERAEHVLNRNKLTLSATDSFDENRVNDWGPLIFHSQLYINKEIQQKELK
jgi:hypothetical protein